MSLQDCGCIEAGPAHSISFANSELGAGHRPHRQLRVVAPHGRDALLPRREGDRRRRAEKVEGLKVREKDIEFQVMSWKFCP